MYGTTKRLLDISAATLGLTILSPILITTAVLIKLDSKGPVLYCGRRVGKDGKLFSMYKFRSMVTNAEALGGSSTSARDPRITRMGHWMRRLKLDELPQLLNVVKGDMSLVGPRPQVEWAVNRYTAEERKILSVTPGITDFASIQFRNEGEILKDSKDPDADYMRLIHPKKMALGLEYVEKRSLTTDIKIVMATLSALFLKDSEQT